MSVIEKNQMIIAISNVNAMNISITHFKLHSQFNKKNSL